jgi:hypothetical protein
MEIPILGITLGQPSLDVGHTNILLLSGNDFPSQGWSEVHIEERYMLDSSLVRGATGK